MLTDEEMLDRMKNGWRGGLPDGTACGIGSTMENTATVRAWLPDVCFRYDIKRLADAGAGDLHWIGTIRGLPGDAQLLKVWIDGIEYKPFDLIPRAHRVQQLDITKQTLPACDAILCRHVLNHLDQIRVGMAIERFKLSGANYLFATQFDEFDGSKEFTRLDMRSWLGDPIESTTDGGAIGCKLAMWRL